MFQLKSTDGEGQVLLFPLFKSRTTIGRDPSNDIVLGDSDVSRWHALILWESHQPVIRDMQSTNGVFVNNVRIHDPLRLQAGDLLIIGSNLFALAQDEPRGAELSRTISLSSRKITALYQQLHAGSEPVNKPLAHAEAFHQTVVRSKHDLMEGAFEKKLQFARFPRLEVQADGLGEACYLLAMPLFRIGRAPDCNLCLRDPHLSAHHAEIRIGEQGNLLIDLHSENGTMINGRHVSEQKLTDGDVIEVPSARMIYHHEEGLGGRFTDFLRHLFNF